MNNNKYTSWVDIVAIGCIAAIINALVFLLPDHRDDDFMLFVLYLWKRK